MALMLLVELMAESIGFGEAEAVAVLDDVHEYSDVVCVFQRKGVNAVSSVFRDVLLSDKILTTVGSGPPRHLSPQRQVTLTS